MNGFAFANPVLLLALAALPAIWWLLRVTPPRPAQEVFPPLRILARIAHREETPATSPWWLTALRMAMAALIIFALSGPTLDPGAKTLTTGGTLALVIDNDWASAADWEARVQTAEALIKQASDANIPVSLSLTADQTNDPAPVSAATALKRLNAARPYPLPTDRATAFDMLDTALQGVKVGTLAYISSDVAAKNDKGIGEKIATLNPESVRFYTGDTQKLAAITNAVNGSTDMKVTASRLSSQGAQTVPVEARDTKGRVLMHGEIAFADGKTVASTKLTAPIELRNDFARLTLEGKKQAGGTYLLDDGFKRRKVGIISGESRFLSQPLLSPLYYIRRALSPYTDIIEPSGTDLAKAIPDMLAQSPSMIVLADIGRLPDNAYPAIENWIKKGGTLVRFAGPRLAAAPSNDPLVPVQLRQGERALGGTLSWSKPQPLAPFPDKSPFAGLPTPQGVLVKRQVLANPSPTLAEHTWASLADGTPLVTGKASGNGEIVLFHTSADTSWSNLPLSGHFVEMLRRLAQLSRAGHGVSSQNTALSPYRLLDAHGILTAETGSAKPLLIKTGEQPVASHDNPPGLYGSEEGFTTLNLFHRNDNLSPLTLNIPGITVEQAVLAGSGVKELRPALLLAAFALLIADTLAVFFMGGAFSGILRRRGAATAASLFLVAAFALAGFPGHAKADDSKPGDAQIIAALDATHLAYAITGETEVDRLSKAGLAGLSDFLTYHTALEPGAPIGLDIAKDDLTFYPIIYWPVSATAPMPSQEAINKIDAYMRSGGTVLFDTQDQDSNPVNGGTSPNTARLQDILSNLDIPPLEPVLHNHVLTKAFYLLQNFPGRYNGSPLWAEAAADPKKDATRPVERGDGVTPIMITSNDFAGAWATDAVGNPLLPIVPPNERQREMAFRAGVNIVMYMLTGNYKSDQVHIPALLERLGQ